jgi:hypothetical protein
MNRCSQTNERGTVKDHGYTCRFYLNHTVLLYEAFKYSDVAKPLVYVGTNIEPLCVAFCSIIHCNILVNYLTFCLSVLQSVCASPIIFNQLEQIYNSIVK